MQLQLPVLLLLPLLLLPVVAVKLVTEGCAF
jgi:hypothetical protein